MLWEQAEPITESESGDFTKAVKRGLLGTKAQAGNVLKFIAADTRQQRKDFEQRFKPPEGFPKLDILKPDEFESIGKRLSESAQKRLESPELQLSKDMPLYKKLPLKAVEAAPTTVAGVGAGIVAGIVTRNPFIGAGIIGVAFGVLSAGGNL